MPNNTDTIVSTVKAEMARRGLTQRAVAKALGISEPAVSERFNGKTRLTVDELVSIAGILDVAVSVLVSDVAPATHKAAS